MAATPVGAHVAERLFGAELYGRTLADRYRLVQRIGAGGMGVVDLAVDQHLDRQVAVKRLHGARGQTRGTSQLRAEAKALAATSHPNIVEVFDVVADGSELFVVMEYVRGRSLLELQREGVGQAMLLDALQQAGRGLAAAHERQLIHRDFKPSNVLVDVEGRVRVCDFGLARTFASAETDEGATTVHGTPVYMSPEQHAGEELDPRSDQYSFCVAAWTILTTERPFVGTGRALARSKSNGPPRWPTHSDVPPQVIDALRRGLSPTASRRWPSMDALLKAMETSAAPAGGRGRRVIGAALLGLLSVAAVAFIAAEPNEPEASANAGLGGAATRMLQGRVQLHEGRAALVAGREGEVNGSLRAAFDDASAAGNLDVAMEAAAWLSISASADVGLAAAHWARTAQRLEAQVSPTARLAALVLLADGVSKLRGSRPGDARVSIGEALTQLEGSDSVEESMALQFLASTQWHRGELPLAIETSRRAEAFATRIFGPSHARVIAAQLQRGKIHRAAGELDAADAVLTTAANACAPGSRGEGRVLLALASTKLALIRFGEASTLAARALEILENEPSPDTTTLFSTLILLAQIAEVQQDLESAVGYNERLRVVAEAAGGSDTQVLGIAYSRLASLNDSLGDTELAESYFKRAIATFETTQQPVAAAALQSNYAQFLAEHGRPEEARARVHRALPLLREAGDEESLIAAEGALGIAGLATEEYAEAERRFAAARAHVENLYGPQHPVAGMLLAREALAVALGGGDADDRFERAIALQIDGGAPAVIYAFSELWYAQALWASGRRRRARALVRKARPIAGEHPGATPPELHEIDAWIERTGVVPLQQVRGREG